MSAEPIAIAIALLLSGCRSNLVDPDAFSPPDLSTIAPTDAAENPDASAPLDSSTVAPVDAAQTVDAAGIPCGIDSCDATTQECVFIDRGGECASEVCAQVPPACANDRTCTCLGDAICAPFKMGKEMLHCAPAPPGPFNIYCVSTLKC